MILCSVRQHKARCVIRYDQVTAQATTYDELMTGFLASLGDTMHEEAHLHHLWYDIRAQTVFEAALRADVVEIDKNSRKYDLAHRQPFCGAHRRAADDAAFGDLRDARRAVSIFGDAQAIAQMQADLRLVVSTTRSLR